MSKHPRGLTRRRFLQTGAAVGAGAAVVSASRPALASRRPQALRVDDLRTDGRTDPLGTHATRPRLSWICHDDELVGDRRQTAYQVRAASSAAALRAGRTDLWDTGRVGSSANLVAYDGPPLRSRAQVHWQVRVWDEHGTRSAWGPPARFELGLLHPQDWTARWIGNADWDKVDAAVPPAEVAVAGQRARFVRLSVTKLGLPLQEGWPDPVSRLQLAEIEVFAAAAPDTDLARGAAVTATDVYSAPGSWEPEYLTDGKTDGATAPLGFTSLEHHGQDVSADPITITLDLGATRGFDGVRLWPRTDTTTSDGQIANFPVDFTVQVADAADGPWTTTATVTGQAPPTAAAVPAGLPLFAAEFDVAKPVAQARLYVTGLGAYVATVNGRSVADGVLTPGYTDFSTRVEYAALDVTDAVRRGANVLGMRLGTGIYDTLTYGTRYAKFNARVGPPKLLAQLEVTHPDGSTTRVDSDTDWRTTTGPTTFANFYGGEDYDARREIAHWDDASGDRRAWDAASAGEPPAADAALVTRRGPAVEAVDTLHPVKITTPKDGVHVVDFGTNIAGWQHLSVRGPAGTKITMRPAELLAADGTIDYGSTGNPIYDVYTLRGKGTETWHPDFEYHGFRYIQLEGLPSAPTADTVHATVLRSANERAGTFTCSNQLLDDVHRIIDRATQSNMFSVLTDCPQREKLGWMEQDHLVFETVTRNYDIAAYGHDLLQAMADAQLDDGLVPDIAPEFTVFGGGFRDDPNWGNAVVLVAWAMYRTYGDREILRTYYPNMTRYVDYLSGKATGDLLDYGLGDWATINATTPTGVTATFGYFRAAEALAKVAGVLGKTADATRYRDLATRIGRAFHAKYFDAAQHTYATGSQCSDALALDMGVVPGAERAAVLEHLVANLRDNGYHLNLGEIGLPSLFAVLAREGRSDVVYQIATQTTAPSYGAMLAAGATSLTEFWDGQGSQNHFMLGAVDSWFTGSLAGIGQLDDAAGFDRVLISPAVVGDLTHVRGTYATPHGDVRSEWHRTRNGTKQQVVLQVEIPVGVSATLRLPGVPDAQVGSGRHVLRAPAT